YQWFQGTAPDTSTPLGPGQTASNTRWVNQVYVDLLGRAPTAGEASTFIGLLGGGAARSALALTLLHSNEARRNRIASYTFRYLNRAPAAADTSFFLAMFTSGFTDEQVAAQMIGSPEFFTLAGGTNSGFVNRMFQGIVNRFPSGSEMSTFLTLLGS